MIPIPQFDKSLGYAIKKEDYEALLKVVRAAKDFHKAANGPNTYEIAGWDTDGHPLSKRGVASKELREALEALPEHLRDSDATATDTQNQ